VPRLSVVRLSEAFERFWHDLAADLAVTLEGARANGAVTCGADVIAVVLAAGGAERDALRWLQNHAVPTTIPTLVVGSDPCRRVAMQMVRYGANDYFALPEDVEVLRSVLAAALTRSRERAADSLVGDGTDAFAAIVGGSASLQAELERAATLARHRNASALILGDTGTGKELLARAIHGASPRAGAPFVAVNCSALPEHLVESELFGHERGAFTDAHAAKPGLFEVANGGTLFLDEIGDIPLPLQAKLLRALDDKEIRRVGGTKSRAIDVRILAATNEDLDRCVREGIFREDLYFRLSTVVFRLPPLRDRGDDVLLITTALLERLASEHQVPIPPLTDEVRQQLLAHPWPGNVRELKNAIERALLLSPPGRLHAAEILPATAAPLHGGPIPFPAPLADITAAAARATVEWCNGNRAESARRLGISPRRLRRLLAGGDGEGIEDDQPEPETVSA